MIENKTIHIDDLPYVDDIDDTYLISRPTINNINITCVKELSK